MNRSILTVIQGFLLLLIGAMAGVYAVNIYGNGQGKFSRTLELVQKHYMDATNTDSLEDIATGQLLHNLDPHSTYLPPARAQLLNQSLDGAFVGIGIEFQLLNDSLFVGYVYPDGPAQKAGLRPGDCIVKVDGRMLHARHFTADSVMHALRGTAGSTVNLSVYHAGSRIPTPVTVNRGSISISSIDAAYMLSPKVGYIKLSQFTATSASDFKAALQRLKKEGMNSLVLDLRNNGGGYLTSATALADEFLPNGKLIMFTQGLHDPRVDYKATDKGDFEQGKLAVLINESSASASEILAGSLQDHDRAILLGRRSFGKGLVQQQYGFSDGSAVNITIARYYTPSGRWIQKSYKDGYEAYQNEIENRSQTGELYTSNPYQVNPALKSGKVYHTDKGRVVYAGAGIMPDVVIPADSTEGSMLLLNLNAKQQYTAFALQRLCGVLGKYASFKQFNAGFNLSDDDFTSFIVYATKALGEMDSAEIARGKATIKRLVKAHLARIKWGNDAFYQVMNTHDVTLQQALKTVN